MLESELNIFKGRHLIVIYKEEKEDGFVITNALWKGTEKNVAIDFIERVKSGEFTVYTPYILLELIRKWKDKALADKIFDFFKLHSTEIITVEKLLEKDAKIQHGFRGFIERINQDNKQRRRFRPGFNRQYL